MEAPRTRRLSAALRLGHMSLREPCHSTCAQQTARPVAIHGCLKRCDPGLAGDGRPPGENHARTTSRTRVRPAAPLRALSVLASFTARPGEPNALEAKQRSQTARRVAARNQRRRVADPRQARQARLVHWRASPLTKAVVAAAVADPRHGAN